MKHKVANETDDQSLVGVLSAEAEKHGIECINFRSVNVLKVHENPTATREVVMVLS